jgi:hypothetical protein
VLNIFNADAADWYLARVEASLDVFHRNRE